MIWKNGKSLAFKSSKWPSIRLWLQIENALKKLTQEKSDQTNGNMYAIKLNRKVQTQLIYCNEMFRSEWTPGLDGWTK